ncbi:MAG: DNA topoisomerase IV subunit A [Rhodocyclaceae bacterium]
MSNETPDLFDSLPPPEPPAPPPPPEDEGESLPLHQYAERAYLAYAMSVVRGRALPQVEDGLKPVQRRILFAMNEMRLAASAKHVKSARVVGDVIGKYHPHGDTSVYDAAVRMAQEFTLRYPLVDGQGNFGSRDGDSAAAMRYTETRLTPIAELLLAEIDRGTVDFIPNYDGAFKEPQLLPARLPFVLLNGASGIAVGMATEIPPHNLIEVAQAAQLLIRKPDATLDDLLLLVPGPDFPGGGQIISAPQVIRDAYESGRGSIRMRARWRREDLARGQWRIIVDELPHGVSCAQVLSEIETLTNPQPRAGKKDVSQEQKTLKQLVLGVLETVRDESSDKAPIRIVLEPRSCRLSPEEFMNVLLAQTNLETSVPINLTMIGRDGRPQQKGLVSIVREWVDFRYVTVERRTRHRLGEVDRRIHILEGRMIVFLRIEEVIRVIRESDEPKSALIAAFGLTEMQAEDILEIRLRQLARLEGIRIEKELGELRIERGDLQTLLDSRPAMTKLILKEITEDAKKYGDARRTVIQAVAPVAAAEIQVPDEPVTVILSRNGWVRVRQGHGIDVGTIGYKTGDFPMLVAESRTTWPLLLIDSKGRAYSIRVADLPGGRGDGLPVSTMVEFQDGAKLAQALTDEPEKQYLFANSGGYGFIATLGDLVSRQKAGKAFMTLEKGERLLLPAKALGDAIAAVSEKGRLLIFGREEMKVQSGGRGVVIMGLDEGEALVAATVTLAQSIVVEGVGRGGKAKELAVPGKELPKYRLHRARKGCLLPEKLKPTGIR